MSTVADRIVARLQEAGVSHIFGMPGGGGNLDLIDAAGRAGLPFVLTATETGGAIAAIAQAEITHRPGACLTTLGPGAASVVNGIACAKLERAPVVVFTDSYPAAAAACTHQRLDHRALLAPATIWSATLASDCAEQSVIEALAHAMRAPGGPVHLDCPGGVLSRECDDRRVQSSAVARRADASGSVETRGSAEAIALLRASRRPLLLAGLGARLDADAVAICRLCDDRRVPAMVTYKAKGVVPDDHEWFGGVFTNAAIERSLIEQADLLIAVGLDPVELIPRPWTFDARIVSFAASEMDDSHVPFAAQSVGDVAAAIGRLEATLEVSAWDASVVRTCLDRQRRDPFVGTSGFSPLRVVEVAAERLARSARVTVDAGAHMFPVTIGWPVFVPNQMLISNGLSTMGFAMPAAIGAALLDRSRPVVAFTGDGGLLMCAGELATAVREHLHIIVIVFADEALSLIEVKQRQRQFPERGVKLGHMSWPALAGAFGAAGFAAGNERELGRALEQAIAHGGPSIIEARVDGRSFDQTVRAIRGQSS
ncbi:MAG TPA: thiamine pyrophosphate-binding protein [Vicinamibacterales bacterium]